MKIPSRLQINSSRFEQNTSRLKQIELGVESSRPFSTLSGKNPLKNTVLAYLKCSFLESISINSKKSTQLQNDSSRFENIRVDSKTTRVDLIVSESTPNQLGVNLKISESTADQLESLWSGLVKMASRLTFSRLELNRCPSLVLCTIQV